MFNIYKITQRCLQHTSTSNTLLRITSYSSARPTTVVEAVHVNGNNLDETKPSEEEEKILQPSKTFKKRGLVATVFESLKDEGEKIGGNLKKSTFTEKQISKAETVNDILSITDEIVSRNSALKIVSTLSQWSNAGKVQLSDFENDPRFIRLCRILMKGNNKHQIRLTRNNINHDDLSTVLGVKGDDEAAKLVASITPPQMIKVMSTLAQKKRRSTPLLQSLAHNLSKSNTRLDIKQCADVLYCMATLSFPEPLLLERICNDICENLDTNIDKSAVIGSIITSIGLLRYRDTGLVESLCEWMLKNNHICRPQDLLALFQTLAVLNCQPINSESVFEILVPMLNMTDFVKRSLWVDAVWSLVILNQANSTHLSSVLNPDFVKKVEDECSIPVCIKLLNINGAAQHLMKYNGPLLDKKSKISCTNISRSKEKQAMVTSILDSLKSLIKSDTYLRKDVNTGMGFLIDAECIIDKKCNPIPLASTEVAKNNIRVAILAYDYRDLCRGSVVPHGGNILNSRLLEAQGYKLLVVPFTDFNPGNKLVQRVKYLEKQFKFIANSAS